MKRFLLAFSLVTATCTFTAVQHATAQTTVSAASFTSKVTQLDANLATGDTVAAKATFAELNTMMIQVLGATKTSIHNATNPTDKAYYTNYLSAQQIPVYNTIWQLKVNLALNRAAIIEKLNQFDALIY